MTRHRYPTLIAAAVAAAFIGAAAAQTQSNDNSRMPADKGMSTPEQAQPSSDQGSMMQGSTESERMDKMQKEHMKNSGAMAWSHEATSKATAGTKQATGQSGMQHQAMNTHKGTHHAGKSKRTSEQAMSPDEKAYREALRDCAKEHSGSQRDSCLDSAIERFHKNA